MFIIYDTNAQKTKGAPYRNSYSVDGVPMQLPAPFAQLTIVQNPQPTVPPGKTLMSTVTADLENKRYVLGWQVVDSSAYLYLLRMALRAEFAKVTDVAQQARLLPMRTSLRSAFDNRDPEAVIRQAISDVDVSDDDFLQQIKDEMLSLPQWTVS